MKGVIEVVSVVPSSLGTDPMVETLTPTQSKSSAGTSSPKRLSVKKRGPVSKLEGAYFPHKLYRISQTSQYLRWIDDENFKIVSYEGLVLEWKTQVNEIKEQTIKDELRKHNFIRNRRLEKEEGFMNGEIWYHRDALFRRGQEGTLEQIKRKYRPSSKRGKGGSGEDSDGDAAAAAVAAAAASGVALPLSASTSAVGLGGVSDPLAPQLVAVPHTADAAVQATSPMVGLEEKAVNASVTPGSAVAAAGSGGYAPGALPGVGSPAWPATS
jgi:hypothetical protein